MALDIEDLFEDVVDFFREYALWIVAFIVVGFIYAIVMIIKK